MIQKAMVASIETVSVFHKIHKKIDITNIHNFVLNVSMNGSISEKNAYFGLDGT